MYLKTQLFITLSLLLSLIGNVFNVRAQIPVETEMIPFPDRPDRQAFVVTIPVAELTKVNRRWEDYAGENAYGWESQKNGVHRQRGVMEKSISDRKFAIYNQIVMTDKGVRLTIWFDQNGCPLAYAQPGDKMDIAIKRYIRVFALDQYKKAIRIRLKEEQKTKRKMEMELSALHRAQENPKRAIAAEDYRGQVSDVSISMVAQNTKMQELLDKLSAIP